MIQLTDVTLMTVAFRDRAPTKVLRLYDALLAVGVLVQMPAEMADCFKHSIDIERTVIAIKNGDTLANTVDGYLYHDGARNASLLVQECAIDTDILPLADGYRLMADSSLFLTDYTVRFEQITRRNSKPAALCVRGTTSLNTALSVDWLLFHGSHAVVSFLGAGGYASLAEVVMALTLHGTGAFHPKSLCDVAQAFEELTEQSIPPHQPVVGSRIFHVSSGVHVNGILKDRESFEPFAPETVGMVRRIVLGKHSGTSAVVYKLKTLGYKSEHVDMKRLLTLLHELGEVIGEVTDEDFCSLIGKTEKEDCV